MKLQHMNYYLLYKISHAYCQFKIKMSTIDLCTPNTSTQVYVSEVYRGLFEQIWYICDEVSISGAGVTIALPANG